IVRGLFFFQRVRPAAFGRASVEPRGERGQARLQLVDFLPLAIDDIAQLGVRALQEGNLRFDAFECFGCHGPKGYHSPMGYEFNPQSQRFDVANPHRVENLFLAVGAALLILSGFASLFIARSRMPESGHVAGWVALVAAVLTLFAGFTLVTWILWQLRFYFGREQPNSLAPNMTPTQSGEIGR